MPPPSPQPSVLLLERVAVEPGPVPDARTGLRPPPPPVVAGPAPGSGRGNLPTAPLFPSPGLALLAAVSILEGYRWFGVIANSGSRPWAVAFAVTALPGALALTRVEGARGRSTGQRLVVVAAVVATVATAAVLWTGSGWATTVAGIADLALALTALALLAAGERSRRRDDGAP
jgi:hypothetical protein